MRENVVENISDQSSEYQQQLQAVKDFYMREDVSVQAAGRKDTLIVDNQVIAKRFMLLTVSEAYELYKNEFTDKRVSKSTFFQYRPRQVQLTNNMPHNMCVCQYHANFGFLLEACVKVIKTLSSDFETFLKSTCCNIQDENCMANVCKNCVQDIKNDLVPLKYYTNLDENVKWQHWRKVDARVTLTYTIAPLSDLIHELEVQLPIFKLHFFVKRSQQNYFDVTKKNIKPGELILQVDFAENYRLICQNEVQSAHFSYGQVTIFTCVAWLNGETKSFAIISDKLSHSKYDVHCFITKLVQKLQADNGYFENILIFSDGSSCQFKNKFIVRSLPDFLNGFGCKSIEWNYFATSHGKGAVDGVGAVVKRKVWQLTKTNSINLHDALSFFECARDHINGVQLMYISSQQIEEHSIPLIEKWKALSNIPGIHKLHSISCNENSNIKVARTSSSSKRNI